MRNTRLALTVLMLFALPFANAAKTANTKVELQDSQGKSVGTATNPAGPQPNAIEQFLGAHPAALTFVQTPKPIPTSFGKESFFAVSAFKFTNADGVSRYGRYRVLPIAGNEYLDEAGAAAWSANFLFDEIRERVAKEPVKFHIALQLAEDVDTVDDATVRWP